jgi:hypothetical protein
MSNKQQTAVDLMYQRAMSVLPIGSIDARRKLKETYEQVKEMEKEQKYKFADEYCEAVMSGCNLRPEQYDNITYGGN